MGASRGDAVTDGLFSETSGITSTVATPTAAPVADQPTTPFRPSLVLFSNPSSTVSPSHIFDITSTSLA